MNEMSVVKRSILCAVCIALCVVLPLAFHFIQSAGAILSPMHIPVLLCGLLCGWPFGLLCGIAGPLLSSLFTGMPPVAMLPAMMVELAVYGTVSGLLMKLVRTGKLFADIYISLIGAMLAGRVVAGVARALLFSPGAYSMSVWVASYFVTALPGIIMHLVLVPAIYFALEKAKVVPLRYKKG